MDTLAKRTTYLILGAGVIATSLSLATLAFPQLSIPVFPLPLWLIVVGSGGAFVLHLAFRAGWPYARQAFVVWVTLLVAFGIPDPVARSHAPLVLLIPPAVALALVNPTWVVGVTVAEILVLTARTDFANPVYISPVTLTILAVIIGVLVSARLHLEGLTTVRGQHAQLAQLANHLRASEARYRLIADHSTDMIALVDPQGCFQYVSPSYQTVLGYTPAMLLGRASIEFVHPDDAPAIADQHADLIERGRTTHIFRFRHADGTWRWVETSAALIVGEDDRPTILSVTRDVTDRLLMEGQMRQAQKMESFGRLAGGVAHDFNNLLTIVLGAADSMSELLPPDGSGRDELKQIHYAARSGAQLTRQLLTFARKQSADPRPVRVNDLIVQLDKLLRRLIGADIELAVLLTPEPTWIRVDPGHFEQVIMNLAVNARDAMPDGGTLTISASVAPISPDAAIAIDLAPGAYVEIHIRDTGAGIPQDVLPHIFEPFFTTKERGQGTGLGLSTCYGIMRQHGGGIRVMSTVGVGTTITLLFPVTQAPEHEGGRVPLIVPAMMPSGAGSETILLAEDESMTRAYIARALRAKGYTVLEAEHGDEALRVVAAHTGPPIRLLLTDMVMPQLGGRTLADQLRAQIPGIQIIYMTGYSRSVHGPAAQGASEGEIILQKPVAMADVTRVVREVLDRVPELVPVHEPRTF